MILKSLGRKSSNFGQLLAYILKQGEKDPVPSSLIWKQNVFGNTIEDMEQEYLENEMNRTYQRSGVNKMYHEWLSISDLDKERVNDDMLKALALEYGKLRNPSALIVSAVHKDKDHIHIHFCVSGTEIVGKSLRISKQEFNELKKSLQKFQIEKFPQLQNSIIDFDKKSKNLISDREYKVIERKGISQKQLLKENIVNIYEECTSKEMFLERLKKECIETYTRGKNTGIVGEGGRHFRLNNFLGKDWENEISNVSNTLKNLENIRGRNTIKEIELGTPITAEHEEVSEDEIIENDSLDSDSQLLEVIFDNSENTIEKILKINMREVER